MMIVIMLCSLSLSSLRAQPKVTTDMRYARGSSTVFCRSTVSGTGIKEQGFCWSAEKAIPTVDDSKTTDYLTNNGRIYKISNLTPATRYYVRAYAINTAGDVGYGNVLKVFTIPKGKITYDYDNGGSAEENTRIKNALEDAVDKYWNNYTSISGLNISCHYGSETPTADCSYGGWMRVGPSSSYQATGTIMHEMNHAIGGGTTYTWMNEASLLHYGSGTRNWKGIRANEVLRFWDNNTSDYIKGDNTHFWPNVGAFPYGINGAHEDKHNEVQYIGNALINQAFCEDGLICVNNGYMLPAYSFNQEDNVKYYLRSAVKGNDSAVSYLVAASSTKYEWREMTADEVLGNDNTAWTITFNPQTQYYQFKNIGTGQFLKNSTNTNIHLLQGEEGYYIIYAAARTALTANINNGIGSTSFYPDRTNAENLRWLIYTADDVKNAQGKTLDDYRKEVKRMTDGLSALLDVPHTETTENIDETTREEIHRINIVCDTTTIAASFGTLKDDVRKATRTFLLAVELTYVAHPFDVTYLLEDSLADASEYTEKTFELSWTVENLARGFYKFCSQAFQRPGDVQTSYDNYIAGTNDVKVEMFINTKTAKLTHIAVGAQPERLGYTDTRVAKEPNMYVPNNLKTACLYFDKELYESSVVQRIYSTKMTIGIRDALSGTNYWTCLRGLRLLFYGSSDPVGIEETRVDRRETSVSYDLQGRAVGEDYKGVVITNNKKYIRK